MSYIKYKEPYIYVAGLNDTSALIAWGKFFFNEKTELIDDDSLEMMLERRRSSIGEGSESYGEEAVITITGGDTGVRTYRSRKKNYCWIEGLAPDTEYEYKLEIDGVPWPTTGLFRYVKNKKRLPQEPRSKNVFRTFPAPDKSADLTFAVIGDFGKSGEVQEKVAEALLKAVDQYNARFILTTGDNIYKALSGVSADNVEDRDANRGGDDDDYFYTLFQPYRFVINRIPIFPSIGNHDTGESDVTDDRSALYDNLFISERFPHQDVITTPGLTYRFKYGSKIEFVSIDTSKEEGVKINGETQEARAFLDDTHMRFIEQTLGGPADSKKWKIPFFHHPAFAVGSKHSENDVKEVKESLVPVCERSGVRVMFYGHNHDMEYLTRKNKLVPAAPDLHYILTGGGGDPDKTEPNNTTEAKLEAWGGIKAGHFLIVEIKGDLMTVRPIDENGEALDLKDKGGKPWKKEIKITL